MYLGIFNVAHIYFAVDSFWSLYYQFGLSSDVIYCVYISRNRDLIFVQSL